MKNIIFIIVMIFSVSCSGFSGQDDNQVKKIKAGQAGTQADKSQDFAYNGTYLFDAEKYKNEQLKHADSIFKKMKPKDLERMMQVFRPFKIEVSGNNATASFAHDVIKGNLKTLKRINGGAHLFMTPTDESKRDQTVTLIIKDDELVLDPGRKETDKMFFKRVN